VAVGVCSWFHDCQVSVVECLIWLSVVAVGGCSWFRDCQVSVVECLLWLSGVAADGCSWFLVVGYWLSDFGVDFKGRLSLSFFIVGEHLCLEWLRQHWYYYIPTAAQNCIGSWILTPKKPSIANLRESKLWVNFAENINVCRAVKNHAGWFYFHTTFCVEYTPGMREGEGVGWQV
jgi:hypothetical protein